jgi:phenylacetate-coenzyme A ligase PaaK-like adenylate-forming protein
VTLTASALLEGWLDVPPYELDRTARAARQLRDLAALTGHHRAHCEPYRRIVDGLGYRESAVRAVEDIPFLPVRLFKTRELMSVPREAVVKTMTSSGTSGQQVSKIFLDRDTAAMQTKVLARLVQAETGPTRLPMLVVDAPSVLRDRNLFSARGAGILGFSMCANPVAYALTDAMQLDMPVVHAFLAKHAGKPILCFGFTFMVWTHLVAALRETGERLPLERATLIHGGGWKTLAAQAVDNARFKAALAETTGVRRVINYYGMVEQTGSIFMECEAGVLHASHYSDIIIRRPNDLSPAGRGEQGLVQPLSLLPASYPGHSLLSEDLGRVLGEDDCACGRRGKYFEIDGRAPQAEIRGCSDIYASA